MYLATLPSFSTSWLWTCLLAVDLCVERGALAALSVSELTFSLSVCLTLLCVCVCALALSPSEADVCLHLARPVDDGQFRAFSHHRGWSQQPRIGTESCARCGAHRTLRWPCLCGCFIAGPPSRCDDSDRGAVFGRVATGLPRRLVCHQETRVD